jgi:hypothetical protein
MRVFPQLSTGASGQFPIRKRRRVRTVVNECADGRNVKWAEAGTSLVEWEIDFAGLSDAEQESIEQLFAEAEGRLNSFVLLDPAGNLLTWSEDLEKAVWEKGPLVQVSPGAPDPLGSSRATRIRNEGGAPATVQQTVNVPASYWYAFSLYVRSDAAGSIELYRKTVTKTQTVTLASGPQWTRVEVAGRFDSSEESVQFGLELGPGAQIDVFGFQAEAQPSPSGYKKTLASGGVYSKARFAEDSLEMTATGPQMHATRVLLVAAANQ